MKTLTLILLVACLVATETSAQATLPATPQEPSAGLLLEKAGKQKNAAILVGLLGGLMAGAVAATDSDNAMAAAGLGGAMLVGSIGISVSANGKLRQAGKRLQQLGY
jgi:hypothetical protein